jgi:CubicO group peptidase (beta-lactamase class C family)
MLGTYETAGKGIPAGGSGLFSTIGDYLRFAQMLANGGELEGQRVLSAAMVEKMRSNQLTHLNPPSHAFDPTQGYGYGVGIQLIPGVQGWPAFVGTWGWDGAATTYVRICPERKAIAMLFTQHIPYNQHQVFQAFHTAWHEVVR